MFLFTPVVRLVIFIYYYTNKLSITPTKMVYITQLGMLHWKILFTYIIILKNYWLRYRAFCICSDVPLIDNPAEPTKVHSKCKMKMQKVWAWLTWTRTHMHMEWTCWGVRSVDRSDHLDTFYLLFLPWSWSYWQELQIKQNQEPQDC